MASSKKNHELGLELAVGAFVAAVFVGLAVFTIVISGKNLFRDNVFGIEVVLPDAMGLRPNDPVIAKGTTVGTVSKVFYDRDGVHVQAQLEAPVEFHEGYDITVVSTSILGGRQLVLKEGDPATPAVADVKNLVGSKPADLFEDATAAVGKIREFTENGALEDLRKFIADLKEVGDNLVSGEGTLAHLLSRDDSLYTNLFAAVENVKLVTDRLEQGRSSLGKLLAEDSEAYDNLNDTLSNLKKISDRLEAGEGTIGKLLSSDDQVYRDLAAAVADAKDAIADLKSIADRLEKGEGTIGKLLSSDTEVYDNLNGALTDVREVLDDIREANTLSTFTSLLLSGF